MFHSGQELRNENVEVSINFDSNLNRLFFPVKWVILGIIIKDHNRRRIIPTNQDHKNVLVET